MDKVYNHKEVEERIYREWEKRGYFKPEINPKGQPYCIILPPPNANGALHFGHAMYTVEDILIRYHRMKGYSALWLPGTDHAGIETQFVFEKKLKQEGKSRLDFNQETLYKMIWEYVENHRGGIQKQLRRLGFSLDWWREKYTLDPDIVKLVYETFKKMYDDGLIYRGLRLVNYCTFDGTSFSDLEVVYKERKAPLYYLKYGPFTIATVRPETKFRDTALAVNPDDPRYKDKIGKEYEIQGLLGIIKMRIIADPNVNPEFGTGIMKVTPAHDPHDFELGQKYNLPTFPIIGFDGKMDFSWFLEKKNVDSKYRVRAEKYHGQYVKEARKLMVEDLKADGLLIKTDENYIHRIGLCYKCRNVLEPLPMEQWFVKVESLKQRAIEVVKKGKIKIYPKNFEGIYFQWLENLRDWNISRQIAWGIRIPAWFCGGAKMSSQPKMGFHEDVIPQVLDGKTKTYRLRNYNFKVGDKVLFENTQTKTLFGYGIIKNAEETIVKKINYKDKVHYTTYENLNGLMDAFKLRNPDKKVTPESKAYLYEYEFRVFNEEDAKKGCGQTIISSEKPKDCPSCKGSNFIQDTDTFDTWFSSGQWPYLTLKTTKLGDFEKYYPTSVMETGYDILKAWVSRMIMMGIYITKDVPFKDVLVHGLVNDPYGKKMSKSKGNVVNPLELIDKYGADSVRFALIYGNATGNDQSLSYPKLDAARKFTNKLWNMARFITLCHPELVSGSKSSSTEMPKQVRHDTQDLLKMAKHENDKLIIKKTKILISEVSKDLDKYNFNYAAERLYDFAWHEFADKYIEDVKNRINENSFLVLSSLFLVQLKLLHPFMPFVTEEIYQRFGFGGSIMTSKWPI